MKKNQTGFSAVEALLVLVFLAIICFAGYFVWHAQKISTKTDSTTAAGSASSSAPKSSSSTSRQATLTPQYVLYARPGDIDDAIAINSASDVSKLTSASNKLKAYLAAGPLAPGCDNSCPKGVRIMSTYGDYAVVTFSDSIGVVGPDPSSGNVIGMWSTQNGKTCSNEQQSITRYEIPVAFAKKDTFFDCYDTIDGQVPYFNYLINSTARNKNS